jgi:hypothetical protein
MQRTLKQIITESQALKAVIAFFVTYIILSVLWIQVRDIYGYGITFVASKFVAEVKDARLEELIKEKNVITASFSSIKRTKYVYAPVMLSVYSTTSNVPLILSLLVSLFPFIKRKKRAYAEALLILLLFHLLYVFFSEMLQLTKIFMTAGLEEKSLIRLSNYYFLWGVMENASMSFAPFLIVIYIFMRFRR